MNKEQQREYSKKWHAMKKATDLSYMENRRAYSRSRSSSIEVKRQNFESKIKRLFGLNAEDYARKLNAQNLCCDSCGDALRLDRKTHVDHDHKTGKCRGIICESCNVSLGRLMEDPIRIRMLADYIERWVEL